MGTKKPSYKCEECHVGEGKVTGLSGDLLCLDCARKQRQAACDQATFVKKPVSDSVASDAILGHFSSQEISNAKDILWEKCDVTIIGDKLKRRDSSVR